MRFTPHVTVVGCVDGRDTNRLAAEDVNALMRIETTVRATRIVVEQNRQSHLRAGQTGHRDMPRVESNQRLFDIVVTSPPLNKALAARIE